MTTPLSQESVNDIFNEFYPPELPAERNVLYQYEALERRRCREIAALLELVPNKKAAILMLETLQLLHAERPGGDDSDTAEPINEDK